MACPLYQLKNQRKLSATQGGVLKETKAIRLLWPLVRTSAWGLPATILLGIVSSLAESAGLSLFVPLFQSLDRKQYESSDANYVERFFHFVLGRLPQGDPLPYIVGLVLAMTISKGMLTYGHSILAASINARATHTLPSRILSKLITFTHPPLTPPRSARP